MKDVFIVFFNCQTSNIFSFLPWRRKLNTILCSTKLTHCMNFYWYALGLRTSWPCFVSKTNEARCEVRSLGYWVFWFCFWPSTPETHNVAFFFADEAYHNANSELRELPPVDLSTLHLIHKVEPYCSCIPSIP